MIPINYPQHDFRRRQENGKEFIFDELRKIWLKLTPEEWVRQNFLQYLLQAMSYPAALIAIEKEIQLGELKKRFDILVYNKQHHPWMMVECKDMNTPLSEGVLQQVLRYNIAVPVTYMIITNGAYCIGFQKNGEQLQSLRALPDFSN